MIVPYFTLRQCEFVTGRAKLCLRERRTLYKILGEIIEVLYGNNLGCDASENLFDIASSLLQFEQKYIGWQHSLPVNFSLIVPEPNCSMGEASST
jgi:hypothetical protein